MYQLLFAPSTAREQSHGGVEERPKRSARTCGRVDSPHDIIIRPREMRNNGTAYTANSAVSLSTRGPPNLLAVTGKRRSSVRHRSAPGGTREEEEMISERQKPVGYGETRARAFDPLFITHFSLPLLIPRRGSHPLALRPVRHIRVPAVFLSQIPL